MTIISAAVQTKTGTVLFSRQFIQVNKTRIESLYNEFQQFIGNSTLNQHNLIETDQVLFLYRPIESLYLVLITTKSNNILDSLESLNLMSRIIIDSCKELTEQEIKKKMFELIFAFDEIVSFDGKKENVDLNLIKSWLLMESQEEIIQEMINRNKEREAKEAAKLKMKQIEMQKKEAAAAAKRKSITGLSQPIIPKVFERSNSNTNTSQEIRTSVERFSSVKTKGMTLGKKSESEKLLQPLAKPTSIARKAPEVQKPDIEHEPLAYSAKNSQDPLISFSIEEKISLTANRDGGIDQLEIKGEMSVTFLDQSVAKAKISLNHQLDHKTVQFKTHPNVDKTQFTESNLVTLKDSTRSFPVNQPVGILKWRVASLDQSFVPLTVNCWPSMGANGKCSVTIEYQLDLQFLQLFNTKISIPLASNHEPQIHSLAGDSSNFDREKKILNWEIGHVSALNSNGALEFTTECEDPSIFFPISISFESNKSICQVFPVQAYTVDTECPFTTVCSLQTEEYNVV